MRGKISFFNWRLRFQAENVTREIPLTRVKIELDSAEDEQISFFDPNDREWRIYTFGLEILNERPLRQQVHTRNQLRKFQSKGDFTRKLKLIGAFVAMFAVLCLIGSFVIGLMVTALVHRVPPQWEQSIGEDVMKDIRRHATFIHDTNLQATVETAVAPLLKVLPKDAPKCKFYIMDDPIPNAFALPGGYVVVHTGLLKLTREPEEIAGVVAHELAHVTQRHGVRLVITAAGPFFVMKTFFGGGEGMLGALGASSQVLVQRGFSQEFETQADDVGWQYLVDAHIDPRGLAGMLKKLEDAYASMVVIRPDMGAFSSHPATVKRIERLDAKWNKLKDKSGFIHFDEPPPQPR